MSVQLNILQTNWDWDQFISNVKVSATADRVWKYINPDLEIQPTLPDEEIPEPTFAQVREGATTLVSLSADEKATYRQMYEGWKMKQAKNEAKLTALATIDKAIHYAAVKHYFTTIQNLDTSWAKLRALRSRLNPSEREKAGDPDQMERSIARPTKR